MMDTAKEYFRHDEDVIIISNYQSEKSDFVRI